jgi:hypothetical protein
VITVIGIDISLLLVILSEAKNLHIDWREDMNIKNTLLITIVTVCFGGIDTSVASEALKRNMPGRDVPEATVLSKNLQIHKAPSPGVYTSSPYTCIVVVPETVDPLFEHLAGMDIKMDDCVIYPPSHLEPRK